MESLEVTKQVKIIDKRLESRVSETEKQIGFIVKTALPRCKEYFMTVKFLMRMFLLPIL